MFRSICIRLLCWAGFPGAPAFQGSCLHSLNFPCSNAQTRFTVVEHSLLNLIPRPSPALKPYVLSTLSMHRCCHTPTMGCAGFHCNCSSLLHRIRHSVVLCVIVRTECDSAPHNHKKSARQNYQKLPSLANRPPRGNACMLPPPPPKPSLKRPRTSPRAPRKRHPPKVCRSWRNLRILCLTCKFLKLISVGDPLQGCVLSSVCFPTQVN